MLQRITAISILAMLLLTIASRYPVFKIDQWQIHRAISNRIKSLLPEHELKLVSITKNLGKIEWTRKGKEFKYKGRLYDVVRSNEKGDAIDYYCINDEEEESLEKQYESFIVAQHNDHSTASNGVSINVLKILFSLIYIPKQDVAVHLQTINLQQQYLSYCSLYSSACISITSPPPKPGA